MASVLSNLVAQLESSGGTNLGSGFANPVYGQYSGFTSQYGSGAAGVDNYASQVLAANPNATLGDFYAGYVLGTGNPAAGYTTQNLATTTVKGAQGAYGNLLKTSAAAGLSPNTPLSSLIGTAAASGQIAEGPADSSSGAAAGQASGADPLGTIAGMATQGALAAAGVATGTTGSTSWITELLNWLSTTLFGGNSPLDWVTRGFLIVIGLVIAAFGLWQLLSPDLKSQLAAVAKAAPELAAA